MSLADKVGIGLLTASGLVAITSVSMSYYHMNRVETYAADFQKTGEELDKVGPSPDEAKLVDKLCELADLKKKHKQLSKDFTFYGMGGGILYFVSIPLVLCSSRKKEDEEKEPENKEKPGNEQ